MPVTDMALVTCQQYINQSPRCIVFKFCISVRHPALLATSLSGLPTLSCIL